jgi:hypothetical protein
MMHTWNGVGHGGSKMSKNKIGKLKDLVINHNSHIIITQNDCMGKDEYYGCWYRCPICNTTNINLECNYCPSCGNKIIFD